MRIDRIESFTRPDVGFVRVTSEDGAFGWGQMSTYHADITAQVLHRQVAPWVTGRFIDAGDPVADFLDIAAFLSLEYSCTFHSCCLWCLVPAMGYRWGCVSRAYS